MKKGAKIAFILLSITALYGCARLSEKFSLEHCALTPLGTSGVTLHTCIDNASRHTLHLSQGEVRLYYGSCPVVRAEQRGEVTIPKRTISEQKSRWKLVESDPAGLRHAERLLQAEQYDSLSADYRLTLRKGRHKKTFSGQMVPLSEFLRTLHRE